METKEKRNLKLFRKKNASMEVMALRWLENVKWNVKESSYVKYRNLVQNHILPELGGWPAVRLTTEVIEEFVQKKLQRGKLDGMGGLSEKSVRDILAVVKEICLYAMGCDVEIPCRFERIKIRNGKLETEVLNLQKQKELEQFLLSDECPKKTGVLLSLYMGLRVGEVCALKRQNIL